MVTLSKLYLILHVLSNQSAELLFMLKAGIDGPSSRVCEACIGRKHPGLAQVFQTQAHDPVSAAEGGRQGLLR